MDWTDEGVVLAVRKHGETAALLSALTRERGRHLGLVLGGAGSRHRPLLQPGNLLKLQWRARLSDQLGHYGIELVAAHAAAAMEDPLRLLALASATGLAERVLPEREAHPRLYDALCILVQALAEDEKSWAPAYVRWELGLLSELGFGLDLDVCALTGSTEGLAYVSPKTGKAATAEAAAPYREKLLPLPGFLAPGRGLGDQDSSEDLRQGFALTGYFLNHHVLAPHGWRFPDARDQLVEGLARPNRPGHAKASP